MSIVEQIRKQRPNIKDTTINSYFQYIKKLYQTLNSTTELPTSVSFLNDFDEIEKVMEKYRPNTKKNYYSAIVVALKAYDRPVELISKYEVIRDEVQTQYDNMTKANKKTEKKKENWISLEQYDALLDKYRSTIKEKKLFTAEHVDKKGLETLKEYMILLTYRNLPLRNDFANMRILTKRKYDSLTSEEKDTQNYLVGSAHAKASDTTGFKFYINDYKTKKTFGNKVIEVPLVLQKEIKKYVKQTRRADVTMTGQPHYYLTDTNQNPITPNGITKLLTKIFKNEYNKNVSSSMIRHIILSEKYGDVVQNMKNDSALMLHSVAQQKNYTKSD